MCFHCVAVMVRLLLSIRSS